MFLIFKEIHLNQLFIQLINEKKPVERSIKNTVCSPYKSIQVTQIYRCLYHCSFLVCSSVPLLFSLSCFQFMTLDPSWVAKNASNNNNKVTQRNRHNYKSVEFTSSFLGGKVIFLVSSGAVSSLRWIKGTPPPLDDSRCPNFWPE